MRLKGRFLFLSITDENGQKKMAADEKSTLNKGNNKITELRTILQRESQNS